MQYRWIGKKPLRRHETVLNSDGKATREIRRIEISRGDVFEPTEAELRSFPDLLERIDAGLRTATADAVTSVQTEPYFVRSRGHNWYDVIDSQSQERVNEQALREDVARQMCDQLIEKASRE